MSRNFQTFSKMMNGFSRAALARSHVVAGAAQKSGSSQFLQGMLRSVGAVCTSGLPQSVKNFSSVPMGIPSFAAAPVMSSPAANVGLEAGALMTTDATELCDSGEGDGEGVAGKNSSKKLRHSDRHSLGPPWTTTPSLFLTSVPGLDPQLVKAFSYSSSLVSHMQLGVSPSLLHASRGYATVTQAVAHSAAAAVTAASRSSSASTTVIGRTSQGHHAPVPAAADGHTGATQGDGAASVLSTAEYLKKHNIRMFDKQADKNGTPTIFQAFEDAGFHPSLTRQLYGAGYKQPSHIQAACWPLALAGRDLVAIAPTGSGKTAGFVVPALLRVQEQSAAVGPTRGPVALVLAPTRELAQQIEAEARKFARAFDEVRHSGAGARGRHHQHAPHRKSSSRYNNEYGGDSGSIGMAALFGGASRMLQLRQLRRSPQIVVATPGRLLDFVEAGELDLSQVSYLVLDEADRMLDMGFTDAMDAIVSRLPPARQTLFFSATWPHEVQDIAQRYAANQPAHVFIGDVQDKAVASRTITQRVQLVQRHDKPAALQAYLSSLMAQDAAATTGQGQQQGQGAVPRVIVFTATKSHAEILTHDLNNSRELRCASIHGDKSQAQRDFALQQFRSGRVRVLVATDVAARGLDVPAVAAVVNYDFPNSMDMYVHRIGRTGRAGAAGESMTFLTDQEARWAAGPLVAVMRDAGQEVPHELEEVARRYGRGSRSSPQKYGGSSDRGRQPYGRPHHHAGGHHSGGRRYDDRRSHSYDRDRSHSRSYGDDGDGDVDGRRLRRQRRDDDDY